MKRWEKIKLEEIENLTEMANIFPEDSGINFGYMRIINEKRHPQFPHLHFTKDLKLIQKEFVKFSINSDISKIEIIEEKDLKLNKKEITLIKKFISINSDSLIEYYLQGETIHTKKFLNNLQKI